MRGAWGCRHRSRRLCHLYACACGVPPLSGVIRVGTNASGGGGKRRPMPPLLSTAGSVMVHVRCGSRATHGAPTPLASSPSLSASTLLVLVRQCPLQVAEMGEIGPPRLGLPPQLRRWS
jgi:hypothetical protein